MVLTPEKESVVLTPEKESKTFFIGHVKSISHSISRYVNKNINLTSALHTHFSHLALIMKQTTLSMQNI